jgi:hypothetical protein
MPPASIAWLYGPIAAGAFVVEIGFFILFPYYVVQNSLLHSKNVNTSFTETRLSTYFK